ncbi:hypothetical protein [Ligilactobacillus equi]|uniref:Uncharacterized protein n=1 Tax=Ligilactobacillus equi DPC 6820 TaxID=1392007 RepID=V7HY42_9LACO|nr:hypothetical protein [Ligilactobacillus equi]ETA74138.1 hypothetical protein LEQ_2372 [Ligilactobacillus equi DPC 6820]
MISRKVQILTQNLLKEFFLNWAYVFGISMLTGFFFLISSTNLKSTFDSIWGFFTVMTAFAVIVFLLQVPYRIFRLGIQAGVSRQTIWLAEWVIFICLLIVIEITSLISYFLVTNGLVESSSLFGNGKNIFVELWANLACNLTFLTIGTGFSLLNRLGKWIVGIGLPTILFFFIYQLARLYFLMDKATAMHIAKVVQIISNNYVSFILYLLILVGLQYFFTMRQQQRRD